MSRSSQYAWYVNKINDFSCYPSAVTVDESLEIIKYPHELRSDEASYKNFEPEEFVHALAINILCGQDYDYRIDRLYHEQYFAHGSTGSLSDEVDLIIYDEDNLPYAVWEFKSSEKYDSDEEKAIKYQLFGTAPLLGAVSAKLLVYATVHPKGEKPELELKCIDYKKYRSYESWVDAGRPYSTVFPEKYQDLDYVPYVSGSSKDLKLDSTQSDFRSVANSFHNEFFGEHPDNAIFTNLVKCLLAKIHDERTTKDGVPYVFQVRYVNGRPESSVEIFDKVNTLYKNAYLRYIDRNATPDEIDPKEFSKEKVKSVVLALESLSITRGAALHGDVIGAFFEEILRSGFKQDKGMYFTHSNLVKFIIEALDLEGLTKKIWKRSTHPDNRLPYIIDPACGSGAFLLHSMNTITKSIKNNESDLVSDFDEKQFYNSKMNDTVPNLWAADFIYGFDPKFVMAITSKVNMVLHGDGSAHMFKYDAFKPFSSYDDTNLRAAGDSTRSMPRSSYPYELCETFDVVLSNPPFGVTLSTETRRSLKKTFSLSEKLPSEALFIERAFQLLRPKGRLGIVLPESIFNAIDLMPARLFLYRMFNIKAVVALPRNVFIDTPTLTSLLFAEKKSAEEISEWDESWKTHKAIAEEKLKVCKDLISKKRVSEFSTGEDLRAKFVEAISGVMEEDEWIYKKGKNSEVIPLSPSYKFESVDEAAGHYLKLVSARGISKFLDRYAFKCTVKTQDQNYSAYLVDEVGYKLSKRKEKSRPNQLMKFVDSSGEVVHNLHLCDRDYSIAHESCDPETVLDYIKRDVAWS